MSGMGKSSPINSEFRTIESVLDFFEATEAEYYEVCDEFKAYRPTVLTLGKVLIAAESHVKAFSETLKPLIYDAELSEFARISSSLMFNKECQRVEYLNSLLGDAIIQPTLTIEHTRFPETDDNPHKKKTIAAKMQVFDISGQVFSNRVMDDTRLFLSSAHPYDY